MLFLILIGRMMEATPRTRSRLATHEPTPLAAGQDKDMDRVLKEARKYYKDKGML